MEIWFQHIMEQLGYIVVACLIMIENISPHPFGSYFNFWWIHDYYYDFNDYWHDYRFNY